MRGRRLIALDLVEMGDSDQPADGYGLKTVVTEIQGFVETLSLTGPIGVVGHEIGTWLAYA